MQGNINGGSMLVSDLKIEALNRITREVRKGLDHYTGNAYDIATKMMEKDEEVRAEIHNLVRIAVEEQVINKFNQAVSEI